MAGPRQTAKKKNANPGADSGSTEVAEEFEGSFLSEDEISQAVIFGTDWTAETVTVQTENISLTPSFQRRDAWSIEKKSRFIESLILGLPVPPIILAEQDGSKGKFLVIDGKQRLLSIQQFWGHIPRSQNNAYKLRGLEVRKDLTGLSFIDLKKIESDYSSLRNQPIRTVVIRNWPKDEFLHLVFLRLNTGSVKLSAQELRQALKPGPYATRVDQYASENLLLHRLLGTTGPDSRMQDTEILGRHIAYVNFFDSYPGRLKTFIDSSFEILNKEWENRSNQVEKQFVLFDDALKMLFDIFHEQLARKPGSRLLNKALLDPLVYYFESTAVQKAVRKYRTRFKTEYETLLKNQKFIDSISLDTASTKGTAFRFAEIARLLNSSCRTDLPIPRETKDHKIAFRT